MPHAPSKVQPEPKVETVEIEQAVTYVDPPDRTFALPATEAPTFSVHAKNGGAVELCDPVFKPPGRVADHDTDAVGVWVSTPSGWRKTAVSPSKAFAIVRKSKTAEDGLAALLKT